jgi:hypothetical protein
MPYVECQRCGALTYVPRSYLAEPERCPACEKELDATALLPLAIRRAPPLGGAGGEGRSAER